MAFTTYANWNAFLSDNNISNFTYVNDIRYDNDSRMTSYVEYDGSYDITDGILVWGMHPYSSEWGYSDTIFVFWLTPNDNSVLLDSAPNTIDNFSFGYDNWMSHAELNGTLLSEEFYSHYIINWDNETLEDGFYANLFSKWYLKVNNMYEGTDYYIPHGRFFYLDSLDGSPWEGEVNPSKIEMYVNAYHYIAPDTNGRTDACKLVLDTDKSGETSSVPNGGSFSVGEYTFTKLYEDDYASGAYYWEDVEYSKIIWIYNNVYYLMDKPLDWGSLHGQSFLCYPYNSTENSMIIDITGPTEIGLVGKWIAPSTGDIDVTSIDPIVTSRLYLKGFHKFNVNVLKPEIIIGLKTLVLDNTGYSLTSLSSQLVTDTLTSYGQGEYGYTLPSNIVDGSIITVRDPNYGVGTCYHLANLINGIEVNGDFGENSNTECNYITPYYIEVNLYDGNENETIIINYYVKESSLEDDYNLTVPASRWEPVLIDTWLNPGTTLFDEAWITPSNYSKLISAAANNGINVRVDYTNNTSTTFTLTSANSGDSEDEIYEIGVYFGDQENPGYIIGIYPGMQQLWLTQDHSQTLIIQQITFTY